MYSSEGSKTYQRQSGRDEQVAEMAHSHRQKTANGSTRNYTFGSRRARLEETMGWRRSELEPVYTTKFVQCYTGLKIFVACTLHTRGTESVWYLHAVGELGTCMHAVREYNTLKLLNSSSPCPHLVQLIPLGCMFTSPYCVFTE